MLKFALGFFVAMIVSFLVTGIYLGYYKSVDVRIGTPNSYILLGKNVTGPYHLTNDSIESVESIAKKNEIPCPKSFGMYLDNPQKTEPEKLKSFVGCVIDESLDNSIPKGLLEKVIKIEAAYLAEFQGSPALGPLKVYPEALDWFEKNKLEFPFALEIYTMKDKSFKTEYIFPIPVEDVNVESLRL